MADLPVVDGTESTSSRQSWKNKDTKSQRATLMGIGKKQPTMMNLSGALVQRKSDMLRHTTGLGLKSQMNEKAREGAKEGKAEQVLRTKVNLLNQVSFISQLSQRQKEMLALVSSVRIFQENDRIIRQGECERKLYILCEGAVVVSHKSNPEDMFEDEKPSRIEQAPGFFGEATLLTGEAHTESVYCIKSCTFIILDGEDFDRMLGSNDSVRSVLELRRDAREADVLEHISFLRGVNPAQKVQILHCMQTISFDEGERICVQGQRGETFFIIVQGSVMIQKHPENGEGEPEILDFKHIFDFFGESALLDDKPRAADVVAVDHVVCLYLHRSVFVESFPQLLELIQESSVIELPETKLNYASKPRPGSSSSPIQQNLGQGSTESDDVVFHHSFDLQVEKCLLFAAHEDWRHAQDSIKVHERDLITGKSRTVHFESVYEQVCHKKLLDHYKKINKGEKQMIEPEVECDVHSITSKVRISKSPNERHRKDSLVGFEPKELKYVLQAMLTPPDPPSSVIQMLKDEVPRNKSSSEDSRPKRRSSQATRSKTLEKMMKDRTALTATSRFDKVTKEILFLSPERRSSSQVDCIAMLTECNTTFQQLCLNDKEKIRMMCRYAVHRTFEKGQSIIAQSEQVPGMYFILRGHVKMMLRLNRGGRASSKSLGAIGPGGCCGYLSMLSREANLLENAIYTASAVCRTEALFFSAADFHNIIMESEHLQEKRDHIRSFEYLTCTRDPENTEAVFQLMYYLREMVFSKDQKFLSDGVFFDRNFIHFIYSGQVGIYLLRDTREWIEIGTLGPGQSMSPFDAELVGLALAAKTPVRTHCIPVDKLEALDNDAMLAIKDSAEAKQEWRRLCAEKNVKLKHLRAPPSWVLRAEYGSLKNTNKEHDSRIDNAFQMSKRVQTIDRPNDDPGNPAPAYEAGNQAALPLGLSVDDSNSHHHATGNTHHKVSHGFFRPTSPLGSPSFEAEAFGKVVDRSRIKQALDLVSSHYSTDVEIRHKVICNSPKRSYGVGSPSQHVASPRATELESQFEIRQTSGSTRLETIARQRDRDRFFARAIPSRSRILQQQVFATKTKNWVPRGSSLLM